MIFKKFEGSSTLNLETMEFEDNSVLDCYGGGKGGGGSTIASPQVQPEEIQKEVEPTAPIQVAEVELEEDEDDIDSKSKTSKKSLKVPLEVSENAGLNNVNLGGSTGLKA